MLLELLLINAVALGIIAVFSVPVGKGCLIRGQRTSGDPHKGIDSMAYDQEPDRDVDKKRNDTPVLYVYEEEIKAKKAAKREMVRNEMLKNESTNASSARPEPRLKLL